MNHLSDFLPYGSELRDVVQHPSLTNPKVKSALRRRGVFIQDASSNQIVPMISTSLFSPSEFESFAEILREKEKKEKTHTRILPWSSDRPLIDALPENIDLKGLLEDKYPRYKMIGDNQFRMKETDPDHLVLEYKCESPSYDGPWYRRDKSFRGQVEVQKVQDGNEVHLKIMHTSEETEKLGNQVAKVVQKEFKEKGVIKPDTSFKKITFDDFTNKSRIRFFLSFTEGNDIFDFEKLNFMDVGPSDEEILPPDIRWMLDGKVRDLGINGEEIHKIEYLKNSDTYRFLEVSDIYITYKFNYADIEGNCKMLLSFPNYFSSKNGRTELILNLAGYSSSQGYHAVSRNDLGKRLNKDLQNFMIDQYNFIKKTT